MGPGMLLLMNGVTVPGTIWLFLASFGLMAWTYRKPWKLGWVSCLMPTATALLCLTAQLLLLNRVLPPPLLLMLGIGGGIAFGFVRSRVHSLTQEEDGSVIAQRTFGYLLVWIAAYVLTQTVTHLTRNAFLVQGTVLTSVFTTLMVATLSASLLLRTRLLKKPAIATMSLLLGWSVLATPTMVGAQQNADLRSILDQVFIDSDFDVGLPITERSLKGDELDVVKMFVNERRYEGPPGSFISETQRLSMSVRLDLKSSVEEATTQFNEYVDWGEKVHKYSITRQDRSLGDESAYGSHTNRQTGSAMATVYFRLDRYVVLVSTISIADAVRPEKVVDGSILLTSTKSTATKVWDRLRKLIPLTGSRPAPAAQPAPTPIPAPAPTPRTPPPSTTPPPPRTTPEYHRDGEDHHHHQPGVTNPEEAALIAILVAILLAGGGISLQVAQSLAQAIADAMRAAGQHAADEVSNAVPSAPPLVDADGDPVIVQDGSYEGGKPGQYWMDGRWVDRAEAEEMIRARRRELAERQREIERFLDENDRQSEERRQHNEREAARHAAERERDRLASEAADKRDRKQQERVIQGMRGAAVESGDSEFIAQVSQLIREGKHDELRELYRDHLDAATDSSQLEADAANEESWRAGVAADAAAFTRDAARAGVMALGGPAGFVPTALGAGAISAAGDGSEAYHSGADPAEVLRRTAGGFASGVKDAGLNAIARMPGAGIGSRIVAPAAADAAETYIRTGDRGAALRTGLVSMVSGAAGSQIDGVNNPLARETADALNSTLTGGATSVAQGGTFGEGARSGLMGHIAGRAGGSAAEQAGGAASHPQLDENRIRDAREAGKDASRTAEQGPITQELMRSQHDEPVLTQDGRVLINPRTGEPVTQPRVDPRLALQQLANPAESRTAKGADPAFQQAVIRTRNEVLYGPADNATISAVTPRLQEAGILRPGDRLVMDTFSTPGAAPSLGADRDARMVIERLGPFGQTERIEVPRQHWERQAEADFARHTMPIAGEITPQSHPEYHRRMDELQHLRQAGWTEQQIRDRAWAEAHNQLFTDRHHVEASADNSDQSGFRRDSQGRAVAVDPSQVQSPVLGAQGGTNPLVDPEGMGRMWGEKSHFYEHDMPEALAQSQKGIDSYLRLREGYRQQNLIPPDINPNLARAMELLGEAPTGMAATPQRMATLEADLQALGYRDAQDAMQKVAGQFEGLKGSTKAPPSSGLTSADLARIARDRAEEDERNRQ